MDKCLMLVGSIAQSIRQGGTTFLNRNACEVLEVTTARQACELLERGIDVVVIDGDPPDHSVEELCRMLRSVPPRRPLTIIALIESGAPERATGLTLAGCNEHYVKPVASQTVLQRIAAAFGFAPRIHYRVAVEFAVEGSTAEKNFVGRCRNMSFGGMLMECPSYIDEGSSITVRLPILPGGEPIILRGNVVRAVPLGPDGPWALGIRFTNINFQESRSLERFVVARKDPF